MAIIELSKSIINGTGGPDHNAIPVYSDNHAPNGGWERGQDGQQLRFQNSVDSGTHYISVDPFAISPTENLHSRFVTFKDDGHTPNYIRVWVFDPVSGHGFDYTPGIQSWVEYSHLEPYNPAPPVPEITIDGTIIAGNISARYHLGIDGDWIERIEG